MKIIMAFDVALVSGRNYSKSEVAEKLGDELASIGDLYMEDEPDTHYSIDGIDWHE